MVLPYSYPAPIRVYAGDTCSFNGYRFNTMVGDVKVPRDLETEGWGDWRAQWRLSFDAAESIELDVKTDEASNGLIYVEASADATAQMTGKGVWDLEARRTVGGEIEVSTFARGKTELTRDVTR